VLQLRELQQAEMKAARLRQPLAPMVADLMIGAARLTRTLFAVPFQLAGALRGHAPRAAGA
jgi:hypothetical protein